MTFVRLQSRLLGRIPFFATVFLAVSLVFQLTPALAMPTLTVNGSSAGITVSSGATVTVSIQNGPGNQWDCVSLNTSPNVNAGWISYAFLTPFSTAGTVTFT